MNRACICDASVVVELFIDSKYKDQVKESLYSFESVAVPSLLDLEVINALRSSKNFRDRQKGQTAIKKLSGLAMERLDVSMLIRQIWAHRANMNPYDAAYVAAAEVMNRPLLTIDQKFARTPGVDIEIINPLAA